MTAAWDPDYVQVCVHHLPELHLRVQVQVWAQDLRTQTELNPGQSNTHAEVFVRFVRSPYTSQQHGVGTCA